MVRREQLIFCLTWDVGEIRVLVIGLPPTATPLLRSSVAASVVLPVYVV